MRFFDLARAYPEHAAPLIGMGLDAMRASAEPSMLLIGGAGPNDSLERIEAAQQLAKELKDEEAESGNQWLKYWAELPVDSTGTLAMRLATACQDAAALVTLPCDPDLARDVRQGLAVLVDSFLHSLSARQSGENWKKTAWFMRQNIGSYEEYFIEYGGLSAQLLAYVSTLSHCQIDDEGSVRLGDPVASAQWAATEWDTIETVELIDIRARDGLLDSLEGCHEMMYRAAVVRELSADERMGVWAEELRRYAESVSASCGTILLNDLVADLSMSGTSSLVAKFASGEMHARINAQAKTTATKDDWARLPLSEPFHGEIAQALDRRRGPFVPGPSA